MNAITKAAVLSFKTKFKSYGHWLITVEVENPYYYHPDLITDPTEPAEPKTITLRHTTTDSRAIDGLDGYQQLLAAQCIRANDYDPADFDLTTLSAGEED